MPLDPDIKKILCDREVANLATVNADLIEEGRRTGKPPFSEYTLAAQTKIDRVWLDATHATFEAN